MPMFVPVSPSGTGKTFSSLIFCLLRSIDADALMTIRRNNAPSIFCIKGYTSVYAGTALL